MTEHQPTLTIRRLDPDADDHVLRRLAGRDSRPVPAEPVIGAEVEGQLLAAISLADGAVVADPFQRTAELRRLLILRRGQVAAQLRSSGAIVRPASESCSQYSSAGSRGPVQTMA